MSDTFENFEDQLQNQIISFSNKIKQLYHVTITNLSLFSKLIKPSDLKYGLQDPLKSRILQEVLKLNQQIFVAIETSVRDAWKQSDLNTEFLRQQYLKEFDSLKQKKLYDPNKKALETFLKRKTDGLNLSKRIWNSVEPYKFELEAGLTEGIASGRSAISMAEELKKNLLNPGKLFRRIKDSEGNLKLSKAAENYNPGQGVYRSSYQNALRLAATETNISYRTSDVLRWRSLPFVTGFRIKLSNSHPEYDVCDECQGVYPKDFTFKGWHPRCLCYMIPVLISEEEMNLLQDKQERLKKGQQKVIYTTDVPDGFKKWFKDNKERMLNWKTAPYWVQDNPLYTDGGIGEFTSGLAPMREGTISDLTQSSKAFNTNDFKKWKNQIQDYANLTGIKIVENTNTVGIYEATSNNAEASTLLTIKGYGKDAEEFAALMGSLAPEMQNSIMLNRYDLKGDVTERFITFSDFSTAADFVANRTSYGTSDLSFAPGSNMVLLLDFGNVNINKITANYGKKIQRIEERQVSSRFISEQDYGAIVQRARNTVQEYNDPILRQQLDTLFGKSQSITIPNDLAWVQGLAKDAAPNITDIVNRVKDKFPIYNEGAINFKSDNRIVEKVTNEYGGDFKLLKDAVRTTLVTDQENINGVIKELLASSPTSEWKQQTPESFLGYEGNIINFVAANGLISEIQVITPEMAYAKGQADVVDLIGQKKFDEIKLATGLEPGLGHLFYEDYRTKVYDKRVSPLVLDEITNNSFSYYSNFIYDKGLAKEISDEYNGRIIKANPIAGNESQLNYARRVIDKLAVPPLLKEKPSLYFTETSLTVPLDKLVFSKQETTETISNAKNRMWAASEGYLDKRVPITVADIGGGKYQVLDGNATSQAAILLDWNSIPVTELKGQELTDYLKLHDIKLK